jgi:hypothetical protein
VRLLDVFTFSSIAVWTPPKRSLGCGDGSIAENACKRCAPVKTARRWQLTPGFQRRKLNQTGWYASINMDDLE